MIANSLGTALPDGDNLIRSYAFPVNVGSSSEQSFDLKSEIRYGNQEYRYEGDHQYQVFRNRSPAGVPHQNIQVSGIVQS